MYTIILALLLLCCTVNALQQSITAPSGVLLGIRYIKSQMEVVTIDITTGDMKVLDTKLNNTDGFLFAATSTTDSKGTYYVALMTASETGSQLFAVDAKSGKTLKVANLQGIYYTFGYDPKANVIYGVEENTKVLSTIYKIDPTSFAETKVGNYPQGSVPFIVQSAYDSLTGVMYDMMATNTSGSFYYGVSVADGSLVSKAPIPDEPTDPILFNLFCDEVKGRLIAVSHNKTAPYQYFLSEVTIKGNSASAARIGTTNFATVDFYPAVVELSSDMRQVYALMANTTNSQYYDWYVIDIDTGAVVQHVHNWATDVPVDLQYVKYA